MKNIKHIILRNLPVLLTAIFFTFFSGAALGQLPTNIPSPEAEPVDFLGSTANVVLYVVIPIVVVVLFIIWRRRTTKRNPDENRQTK
jgi:heme/copper-type cytochrome/quinol oxidase subunit 2